MLNIAHVRQGAAHVPRQKRPTQGPEHEQHGVDYQIESRIQSDEAVEYDREHQGGNAEEGCRGEL